MGSSVTVRASTVSDVPAITEIYGQHVIEGTGSFEIVPPDLEEIAKRRNDIMKRGLPWLVAEVDDAVVGYAYAGPFRAREAYRFTVEDSVYVRPESSGQGVGRMLLEKLLEICREGGYKQMLALIGDSANIASIRLHERCGFQHVGTMKDVGIKLERWLDVVIMQRELS
jgi:L-amino acid N-acyltransferase YncA